MRGKIFAVAVLVFSAGWFTIPSQPAPPQCDPGGGTIQLTHHRHLALPAPELTGSRDNPPKFVQPPTGFLPAVPTGFSINVFARGFKNPRWLAVAPNGDVFVTDSTTNEIIVLRDSSHHGTADSREVFASGLHQPYGVAFHGDYVYVANTDEVVRFPVDLKSSKRTGRGEHILSLPGRGYNQHWTRTIAFSPDDKHLFVSVGSETDASVEKDPRRAAILVCDPDGKDVHVYASGLRNAVGIAFDPWFGKLWASVNERDGLGDNVPPDFFTNIREGGFYGWPYSYIGNNVDARISPPRPDLVSKSLVPDLLIGAHVAPLQIAFYVKGPFPEGYNQGAFLAEHGSWNRSIRSGYEVVFIPFRDGEPVDVPRVFVTGLVPDRHQATVYGRPAGVAATSDGTLLISDDEANVIYRVSYTPKH